VWLQARDCVFPKCRSPWFRVSPADSARAPDSEGARLLLNPTGGTITSGAAGYAVSAGALARPQGDTIALAAAHRHPEALHTIVVAPTGGKALVLSTVNTCACGTKVEGSMLRFALSRVDLAAGRAELVARGDDAAAVALDAAGAVYLQQGQKTRRMASVDAVGKDAGEQVMAGVALTAPWTSDPNCCGL